MKITYRHGNLLDAVEPIIIHGCNAQGRMGSGVAKFIRNRYPRAFEDYDGVFQEQGLRLGTVVWSQNSPHLVGNAITQQYCGDEPEKMPGGRYLSYDAVADAITEVNRKALELGVKAVAMPLIGAGLAAGRWPIIEAIIEDRATDFEPVVYLIDGVIPK